MENGLTNKRVEPGKMVDVQQSERWKHFSALHDLPSPIPTISVAINIDGVALSKSSNVPLHPVQLSILDLPQTVRETHMLTPLMFVQTSSAKFDDKVLLELINEINVLANEGFTWQAWGETFRTFLIPFCVCCDAPMKSKILGIKGHSGYFSCPSCTIKGQRKPSKSGKGFNMVFEASKFGVERELRDPGQV